MTKQVHGVVFPSLRLLDMLERLLEAEHFLCWSPIQVLIDTIVLLATPNKQLMHTAQPPKNDFNSGHFVQPAMFKGSTRTPLGPKQLFVKALYSKQEGQHIYTVVVRGQREN